MAIYAEREVEALVIKADGRIDGLNARQFQEDLSAAISEKDNTVILNFESLSYISSAGIRVILTTAKMLQRRRGRLALYSLTDSVREIFEISGFDQIIPVHTTKEEAISAS